MNPRGLEPRRLRIATLVLLLAGGARADAGGLTGDWGGARTRLQARGLEPYARYTAGLWANLDGGFATGVRYEGFAEWGLDADLEALWGWRGSRFHIGWNYYHGGQPSEDLVGTAGATALSGNEASDHIRFYEIYLEQRWLDGLVVAKLGQLVSDDDFYVSEHASVLRNAAFGFLGAGREQQLAPTYPLAVPGAVLKLEPVRTWQLHLGAYGADPGEDDRDNHGFDWSLDDVLALAEVATLRHPWGRRGRYALGAGFTTRDLSDFAAPGTETGAYIIYATLDQVLLADAAGRPRLGGFLRVQFLPQVDRAVIRWSGETGLDVASPLPGRAEDRIALGYAFLRLGRDFVSASRRRGEDVARTQSVLELTYRARVTPWLSLQPSLQLFFDPIQSRDDAVALGLQAVIDL